MIDGCAAIPEDGGTMIDTSPVHLLSPMGTRRHNVTLVVSENVEFTGTGGAGVRTKARRYDRACRSQIARQKYGGLSRKVIFQILTTPALLNG